MEASPPKNNSVRVVTLPKVLVVELRASTRELMQRMGHSTMRAALIYQHATEARSRELADRLDALVTAHRKVASNDVEGAV